MREQQRLTEQALKTQANQQIKQQKEAAIQRSVHQNTNRIKQDATATYHDKMYNKNQYLENTR